MHTKAGFKAILSAVCKTLSKLTTIAETKKCLPPDKMSPQHFQALQDAGPIARKIPTLAQQPQHNE